MIDQLDKATSNFVQDTEKVQINVCTSVVNLNLSVLTAGNV